MKAIRRFIFSSIKYINSFALFMMFAILLLQVIARKLLSTPLQWPEEIVLVTMIWITFLGAYQCTVEDSHLKMTFLEDRIRTKWKPIIQIIAKVLVIWFLLITNIWAYPFIQSAGSTLMPITTLPMWVPYGMIWLGCILMLFEVLVQIATEFHKAVLAFKQGRSGYGTSEGGDK